MITSSAPGAPSSDSTVLTEAPPSSTGRSTDRAPARAQAVEHRFELRRQRRLGADQLAVDGDVSSSRQACRNRRSRPSGPRRDVAGPVDRVAGDRMADRVEVDADLVRPAGDEVELEQRPAREPLADAVAGHRRPAVGHDRHPRAVLRVAPDRRLDPADRRRDAALRRARGTSS